MKSENRMSKEKQVILKAKKGKSIRQVAAVPFRMDAGGKVEVLLITSRTTKRFDPCGLARDWCWFFL